MKQYKGHFTGERALFRIHDGEVIDSLFDDGESPLKECSRLNVMNVTFGYKYPLWYGNFHAVRNCTFLEMSRSGIWYTNHSTFSDCHIIAPKEFRRCEDISLENIVFENAQETLWNCSHVFMKNITAKGDYLGMNCSHIDVDHLELDGNYFLDGGDHIVVRDSVLKSKDAFWNCHDVIVENCVIEGEYLGWNSTNVTFRNCKIISHQGLCYIKGLTMENCQIEDSDLIFEYCTDLDVEIGSVLQSVKNPVSGTIRCLGVKEMIRDDERINLSKIHVLAKGDNGYGEI